MPEEIKAFFRDAKRTRTLTNRAYYNDILYTYVQFDSVTNTFDVYDIEENSLDAAIALVSKKYKLGSVIRVNEDDSAFVTSKDFFNISGFIFK